MSYAIFMKIKNVFEVRDGLLRQQRRHMITIRDVAREAGVSIGTVSRAFNGYQDINCETKARVFEVASRLGYSPNINAKTLSSKVSSNMGVIVSGFLESDRRSDFVLSLLKGTYRYAFENQIEVALYTMDAERQKVKSYEQFCREHSIFGAVMSGIAMNDTYYGQLAGQKFPCVLIDISIKGNGLGCVSIDNVRAAEEMMEYLLHANHRKIIIVQGKREAEVNNYRLAGIFSALQKRGMKLDKDMILNGEFRESVAYEMTQKYIREHGRDGATAFMCLSDVMAFGAMKAICDLGYSVPEDFSVTGFDGIPITEYITPSLTTIEQDMEEIGYCAAETLFDLAKHPGQNKNVYVPYRFAERNSVKRL